MADHNVDSDDRKWRAALAPLGRKGEAAPHALEHRISRALRARRLGARRMQIALAAMFLLALGGFVGRWWGLASTSDSTEPRFMLLLYEGPGYDSLSSRHEARVAEYRAWAEDLGRRGRLVDAAELAPGEDRLGAMPPATSGYVIGGMFILRARDEAEARAIASTCPHLKHGGGVSVRPMRSS